MYVLLKKVTLFGLGSDNTVVVSLLQIIFQNTVKAGLHYTAIYYHIHIHTK